MIGTSKRTPRIGILSPATESGMQDWWKALKEGLEQLGYVEGESIEFVRRFTDGRFERLPGLAAELERLEVDVIARPSGFSKPMVTRQIGSFFRGCSTLRASIGHVKKTAEAATC